MVSLLNKAASYLQWYSDPVSFFREVAKQEPSKGQEELLRGMRGEESRFLLCCASGVGKTRVLAVAALWYSVIVPYIEKKPVQVLILSGSLEQSKVLYEYTREFIYNSKVIESEIEERLKTETRFKNGSLLRALPCSERSYYGKHVNLLIIDEAALRDIPSNLIDHALSIIAPIKNAKLIMSSTPYDANSRFARLWEEGIGWKKIYWETVDCPWISKASIAEAKEALSREQFAIRWEGKIVDVEDSLIRRASLKACIVDTKPRKSLEPITFGVDWGFSCEEGTEVLSEDGWKRIEQIEERDRVCTIKEGEITFQNPTNIVHSRALHTCYEIKRGNLELHLRPNHLLPVLKRYDKSFLFKDPRDLNHHYSLLRGGSFSGVDLEEWTNDKVRLLGWYLSEGYLEKGKKESEYGKIGICQSPTSPYRGELEQLILRLYPKARIYSQRIIFYDKNLYDYLLPLGKSGTKFIPKEIKSLPSSKLELLIESLMKGDGETWKYKCKNEVKSKVYRYYTKSRRLADDVQELAIKTNRSAWIGRHRNLYRINFISPHKCTLDPKKDIRVYGSEKGFYSFQTPNNTVLIRFNGKPIFIHNVHPTVVVVAQREKESWNILETKSWKKARVDTLYDGIVELYNKYKPGSVYADSSHIFENNKLTELGLPVYPIAFRKEKDAMINNLVSLIEHGKVKIYEEEVALIAQLRDYRRDKKRDDDWVDAVQLALKEGIAIQNVKTYYKVVEYA